MPFTGLLNIQTSRQFLDELSDIGFSSLYRENVPPKDRLGEVWSAKQKLALVEKKVKEEINSVQATFKRHDAFEESLELFALIPLQTVKNYIDGLEIVLGELEEQINAESRVPEMPDFTFWLEMGVNFTDKFLLGESLNGNGAYLHLDPHAIHIYLNLGTAADAEAIRQSNEKEFSKIRAKILDHFLDRSISKTLQLDELQNTYKSLIWPFKNGLKGEIEQVQNELKLINSLYNKAKTDDWTFDIIQSIAIITLQPE